MDKARNNIKRSEYLEKIKPYRDKPLVKILSGVRRSGKSTLFFQIIQNLHESEVPPENIVYINKESLEFDFLKTYSDLNEYIQKKLKGTHDKKYVFVDEIQEIEDWEKAITSLLAQKTADLYITGSNAHLLSSELATLLTGRYIEIPVYPLSFREFLEFRKIKPSASLLESEFDLYLKYGAMPGIHDLALQDEVVYPYLSNLFNSILLKDVVKKHRIRDVGQLERIIHFLMDNIGNISTAKSISDYFKSQKSKISNDTVLAYLEYLQEAFLVYKVKRYSLKGKRHLEFLEKYYSIDLGLRHSILGFQSAAIGGMLENVVYFELKRRGYQVSVGSTENLEIDFIASKQDQKNYIQVSTHLSEPKTLVRELAPFSKIKDHYPKQLLTLDKHSPGKLEGVLHQNIIQFLLGN